MLNVQVEQLSVFMDTAVIEPFIFNTGLKP